MENPISNPSNYLELIMTEFRIPVTSAVGYLNIRIWALPQRIASDVDSDTTCRSQDGVQMGTQSWGSDSTKKPAGEVWDTVRGALEWLCFQPISCYEIAFIKCSLTRKGCKGLTP